MVQSPGPQGSGLALVTGGSSGIGLELARCFAQDGHRLVIVAQDRDRLDRAADELRAAGAPQVDAWSIDLGAPDGGARLFHEVERFAGLPDYLCLNAGTGAWGDFVGQSDLYLELQSIQVTSSRSSSRPSSSCRAWSSAARGAC
jgi:short-subunit dehydrogenase